MLTSRRLDVDAGLSGTRDEASPDNTDWIRCPDGIRCRHLNSCCLIISCVK